MSCVRPLRETDQLNERATLELKTASSAVNTELTPDCCTRVFIIWLRVEPNLIREGSANKVQRFEGPRTKTQAQIKTIRHSYRTVDENDTALDFFFFFFLFSTFHSLEFLSSSLFLVPH
ncbi:hypothetical protein CEXT_768981 [Caerostris extrusa]|uniref:Uncharacterized protein n=1 Tax=Caerostris extrusa TaxID=172846 RepID=A0AAV4V4X4_CAEEX|nr:hypothetical protein CEXT_768981 [Caerostris extrusa]